MTDLSMLTDAEIEREIEERVREQEKRRVLALRAISITVPMFMPQRLYSGTR